jgi:hypothetical protein
MTPLGPVIDVYIMPEGDAWRIICAPVWREPEVLLPHLDETREIFPVGRPDLEELDRFMWAHDAPYEKQLSEAGGVALFAKGRGGQMLAEWIIRLIAAGATIGAS